MESDSVIYGLLGRIHVLMRRTINRITDVEYMRVNADYSREIVKLAQTTGNEELAELCLKLSIAMDLFPQAAAASGSNASHPHGGDDKAHHPEKKPLLSGLLHKQEPDDEGDDRYIRSLR